MNYPIDPEERKLREAVEDAEKEVEDAKVYKNKNAWDIGCLVNLHAALIGLKIAKEDLNRYLQGQGRLE